MANELDNQIGIIQKQLIRAYPGFVGEHNLELSYKIIREELTAIEPRKDFIKECISRIINEGGKGN